MVANDPSAVLNAVICGVIVIVLMFYRRGDATHRPLISLLAYVMVLVYASVPFRFVFGLYESSHWLVVMVNILTLTTSLHDPLPPGAVIHIVPRLAGAKPGGVFQAVLGAALIAVAWWNPAGWLGAAAVSGMYMTGASMILGGVAQMLAPKPKMSEMRQTDNGRQNTYFSSLDNMIANGNTLPVLYGEMQVGSRVISQEVSTADEGDGGQVVVIGR